MPPQLNDFWKELWQLQLETMEKFRAEMAVLALKIAVLETKLAIIAAVSGVLGGIVPAVVVYYLKK